MQNIRLELVELPNSDPINISAFYADYDLSEGEENNEEEEDVEEEEEDYETFTVKQLLRITDYYNIPKSKKKADIINNINEFESNIENMDVVIRRNKLWKYISELKSDKYMKQFIFWS